jgi:hypothetical protein
VPLAGGNNENKEGHIDEYAPKRLINKISMQVR